MSPRTDAMVIRLDLVLWSGPNLRCARWRHQMETFSALLGIWAGNSLVTGEFPAQSPVTRSFDVFFDLRLNKRLSKQWWGWWFETPSSTLWRHGNAFLCFCGWFARKCNTNISDIKHANAIGFIYWQRWMFFFCWCNAGNIIWTYIGQISTAHESNRQVSARKT